MEYELIEVERDYIEFRKELGEYNIELTKTSLAIPNSGAIHTFI